tara:strand:+ start:700 stop:2049 length:1350 start_codon:yes stop_codon:yes gene_type:complete
LNKTSRLDEFISNPKKALFTLSIPMMLGMSVQAIYMLIDTAFIGRWVGGNALAGLGIVFPPMFIIMGITFGLGSGATTVIAQSIGEENKLKADNTAEHIIILGLILSLIFVLIGIFFGNTIIGSQSPDAKVFLNASDYFYTMLWGTPFMILSIFFRSILSGEGDNIMPMKVLGLGTLINLILDPFFIYYFAIKGAALATVLSQAIVFSIFIYLMIVKDKTYISLDLKNFKYNHQILSNILKIGIPASLSMLIMSIGLFFYNIILSNTEFSSSAIAAYSTCHRIEHLFFIPIISLATSMVTLIGMFYGAKKNHLLNNLIYFSLKVSISISIIYAVFFLAFSENILSLFTNDNKIINIGVGYFNVFAFAIPFISIGMTCSRAMQGLGKAYPMFIITCLRVIVISCSLGYYFINILNKPIDYAWIAILISCMTSAIISFTWLLSIKSRMNID